MSSVSSATPGGAAIPPAPTPAPAPAPTAAQQRDYDLKIALFQVLSDAGHTGGFKPQLDASEFDPALLNSWSSSVDTDSTTQQVKNGNMAIDNKARDRTKFSKMIADQADNANAAQKKCDENQGNDTTAGWTAAIMGFLGGCVALALALQANIDSGWKAPELIAAATIGVAMSIDDIASMANQENGGQGLGLTDAVKAVIDKMQSTGVIHLSDDELSKWKMGVSIAVAVAVAVVMIGLGYKGATNAEKAITLAQASGKTVKAASDTAVAAQRGAQAFALLMDTSQATATGVQAWFDTLVASAGLDKDQAQARQRLFEALLAMNMQDIKIDQDWVGRIVDRYNTNMNRYSQSAADTGDTSAHIAARV